MKNEEKSHFEKDVLWKEYCLNPSHNPPTHLYIPSGQKYIHICPGCGRRLTIRGNGTIY